MEVDPTLTCELLVGLGDVTVLGVEVWPPSSHAGAHRGPPGRPTCMACATSAQVTDHDDMELVDLPCFGRPVRLVWHEVRWCCPKPDCNPDCLMLSWTEQAPWIAPPWLVLTDRAGRWVALQVRRRGRSVKEVADELGCDWHTVMDAVVAYGEALIDADPIASARPTRWARMRR